MQVSGWSLACLHVFLHIVKTRDRITLSINYVIYKLFTCLLECACCFFFQPVVLSLIKREIYDVFHIKCKIYSWCIEPPSKISDIHETNWFMYLLTLIKIRRMQSFYKTKSIYTSKIMIFCALIPVNWVRTVNCFVYSTDQT